MKRDEATKRAVKRLHKQKARYYSARKQAQDDGISKYDRKYPRAYWFLGGHHGPI